ncbi:hypothetical protein [Primorskyibacter flagellatus]|uniref:hypothetical protein n=1 Tax=Primorskyibacter flagellatus TaxID=1387277 RepID=UPI001665DD99|nr:hypothetical protein [Primorskyibacter flagellatus]
MTAALLIVPGIAQADWLSKQPKSSALHGTVKTVAESGCTVSAAQWDRIYADHGGTERAGDYDLLQLFTEGKVRSNDAGGHVTLVGLAGC